MTATTVVYHAELQRGLLSIPVDAHKVLPIGLPCSIALCVCHCVFKVVVRSEASEVTYIEYDNDHGGCEDDHKDGGEDGNGRPLSLHA